MTLTLRHAALAAVVLIAAACDRGDAPRSANPATDALLARLPADAEIVASLALGELAVSPAWRRAVGAITVEAPGVGATVATACGLDPWTILDAAAVVVPASPDGLTVAARAAPGRDRLHACLATVAAAGGASVAVEAAGALTAYVQGEDVEHAAWLDDGVVVMQPERSDDAAALEAAVAARPAPPAIADLIERVDPAASLWLVGVPGEGGVIAELLAPIPVPEPPRARHASVRRRDGLHAALGIVFASPGAAEAALPAFRALLADPPPFLARWAPAIRVEVRGDEVRATLALDAAERDALEAQLVAALPPLPEPGSGPPPAPPPASTP